MKSCKNDVGPTIIDHIYNCEKFYIPNITQLVN